MTSAGPRSASSFEDGFLLWLYSCSWLFLWPVVLLAGLLNRSLARQLRSRRGWRKQLAELSRIRSTRGQSFLFFCSSAGEFEQARPLIDFLLGGDEPPFIAVVFFSVSGREFAEVRGETVPMMMSPPDTIWHWQRVFANLRPTHTIVVRHELWPAFLWTAHRLSWLCLLDGTGRSQLSEWHRLLYRWLNGFFSRIYAIEEKDRQYFAEQLGIPAARLIVSGDTKYDRARRRALEARSADRELERLMQWTSDRCIVVGSAWEADLEVVLAADFCRNLSSLGLSLIIAPHEVHPGRISSIAARILECGLSCAVLSELESSAKTVDEAFEVVVVDRMGMLAELYGVAQGAMVGGAFHSKVHNVLEPAFHGIPICFGPRYKNSPEAIQLVKGGVATCLRDSGDLDRWINRQTNDPTMSEEQRRAIVDRFCGATEIVARDLVATAGCPHA